MNNKCSLPNLFVAKYTIEIERKIKIIEACDGKLHYVVRPEKDWKGTMRAETCAKWSFKFNRIERCGDESLKIETFENYDIQFFKKSMPKINEYIRYIRTFPMNIIHNILILTGNSGLGKTYLCKALINENKNAKIIKWLDMCDRFRNFEPTRDILDAEIIVIDDFAEGKLTEWVVESLKKTLDYFLNEKYPIKLIFTTNKSIKELGGIYGEKIVGRIVKDSKIIEFRGGNYNLKNLV